MHPRLAFLLGFSALFPSIAIGHIGNTAGIQVFMLLALAAFTLNMLNGAGARSTWLYVLLFALASVFVAQLVAAPGDSLLVKNFVAFSIPVVCIALGISFTKSPNERLIEPYIRGYSAAAIFSATVALAQYISWTIGIRAFETYRNNMAFGDISDVETDVLRIKRAFAFCPEPSVLALLLLPAVPLLFAQKRLKSGLLVLLGTLATESLTSILFLPGLFLYLNWLKSRRIVSGRNILVLILAALLFAGAAYFLPRIDLRISDLGADGSTLSRLNSLVSGYEAIITRPWIGWGVESDQLREFVLDHSSIFEQNPNIHSLFLAVLAWFGIPVGLFFLTPYFGFFGRSRNHISQPVTIFISATIWPAFVTLNYFTIYSIWLAFGIGSGYALRYLSKANSRRIIDGPDSWHPVAAPILTSESDRAATREE